MRWKAKPGRVWHRAVAIMPVKIDGQWLWLEFYERCFMGEFYAVRLPEEPSA